MCSTLQCVSAGWSFPWGLRVRLCEMLLRGVFDTLDEATYIDGADAYLQLLQVRPAAACLVLVRQLQCLERMWLLQATPCCKQARPQFFLKMLQHALVELLCRWHKVCLAD
jgi:hypothetical protein